jgi:ACS family hexuronate transporter-like MFS transporter
MTTLREDPTSLTTPAKVELSVKTFTPPAGYYRWMVCALLFFAATVNYMDRQVIGLLKPTLQSQIGWNEIDYSNIIFAFQLAYAIGLLFVGKVMDWLGSRKGFSLSVLIWSLAAMAHALASSVMGFGAARFTLGLGEAGSFPASIKSVAEWFPKKERALATGIFNSGTNIGALTTPLLVPWITARYGWRMAFVATGAVGFLWLVAWLALYRTPEDQPRLSKAELDYIRSDPPETGMKIPWLELVPLRQTWAFAIGKFMTDPIWWFFLFWAPDFLFKKYGVSLATVGLPLFVIYQVATVGSIGGGWLSSFWIKRGWSVNASRKTAMLICSIAVVPVVFASRVSNLWLSVGLIALAAAAHQGWSANIFTLASDTFPRRAVGSVVGLGGMFGSVGALLLAKVTGYVLERTGSYLPLFIVAGSAYLIALVIIHVLNPRLQPADLGGTGGTQ